MNKIQFEKNRFSSLRNLAKLKRAKVDRKILSRNEYSKILIHQEITYLLLKLNPYLVQKTLYTNTYNQKLMPITNLRFKCAKEIVGDIVCNKEKKKYGLFLKTHHTIPLK